jgi:archaellum biogenesis protein FlaJ (TadC family)
MMFISMKEYLDLYHRKIQKLDIYYGPYMSLTHVNPTSLT